MKRRFYRYIFMKGRANLILLENILHLHLSLPDCHRVLFSSQPSV